MNDIANGLAGRSRSDLAGDELGVFERCDLVPTVGRQLRHRVLQRHPPGHGAARRGDDDERAIAEAPERTRLRKRDGSLTTPSGSCAPNDDASGSVSCRDASRASDGSTGRPAEAGVEGQGRRPSSASAGWPSSNHPRDLPG